MGVHDCSRVRVQHKSTSMFLSVGLLEVVGHANQAEVVSTNGACAYENTDVMSCATPMYMLKGSGLYKSRSMHVVFVSSFFSHQLRKDPRRLNTAVDRLRPENRGGTWPTIIMRNERQTKIAAASMGIFLAVWLLRSLDDSTKPPSNIR